MPVELPKVELRVVEVALKNGASRKLRAERPSVWREPRKVEVAVDDELTAPESDSPPLVMVR